jgi:hypothetical protein
MRQSQSQQLTRCVHTRASRMRIPLGNTGNASSDVLVAADAMYDTRSLAFNSLVTEIQKRQCQHACVSETKHHRRFWGMLRGGSASRRTGSAYRSHLIYDTRVFREESTRTKAERGLAYRNTRDARISSWVSPLRFLECLARSGQCACVSEFSLKLKFVSGLPIRHRKNSSVEVDVCSTDRAPTL